MIYIYIYQFIIGMGPFLKCDSGSTVAMFKMSSSLKYQSDLPWPAGLIENLYISRGPREDLTKGLVRCELRPFGQWPAESPRRKAEVLGSREILFGNEMWICGYEMWNDLGS